MARSQLGGLLLAFGALVTVAAPFVPSHAEFDATSDGAAIAAFFEDDLALQTLQAWLHPIGAALLVGGVLALFPRLAAVSGTSGLATLVLASALLFLGVTVLGFVVVMGAIQSANAGFDPHLALFTYDLGWGIMVFAPPLLLPFLLVPFGLLARPAGLPRWTANASLLLGSVVAVLSIAALLLPLANVAFLGFVLAMAWALAAGIGIAARPHAGAEPEPTAA